MKASVIIPNLNGALWLRDSIESIYAQTEKSFELIVIDNASTDESLQAAESYIGREGFTLIKNSENTGFSFAVNQGIRASRGKYVILFNNDAFAEPDFISELIAEAEKHKKVFAVQSLMIRHYERDIADDAGDYVTLFGFACKRGDGMYHKRYTKPQRIFSACGGASLYKKSVLDEIGLFDETFFAYFEDVDISWRANSLGYKNYIATAAKCYHICGATTGAVRYNDFKSVQSGRNSLLLPYKNMPFLMLLINLPALLFGYLLKCAVFTLRGFQNPFFKGTAEAFKTFKNIKKPKFRFKNIPNYILIELWLFADCFRYVIQRGARFFNIK